MRRALPTASLVVSLLALCSEGLPQTRPKVPEFGSAITVVSVPVFVTSGTRGAVRGLTAADFEVLDDGRPMKLVGFREIDAVSTEPELLRDSPAARRQFLLLFDLSFSGVNGLVRSRGAALDFIDRMAPMDLAAVATFSANHGLKLLVGFTADRVQLKRAVNTLGVLQLDRRADPLGLAYDLTDLGGAFADVAPEDTNGPVTDAIRAIQIRFERAQEAAYRQRILALLDSLAQLAKALDSVRGRKQVVFLSSGFDPAVLTGEQGAQSLADSDAIVRGRVWEVQTETRFGDTEVRQQLRDALRAFSSSDAVVHTVDLSGLAARGDTRHQAAEPPRRSGHESLAEMANLSGGRLFKDTNDPGVALREILDMSRHYYLLAFEPQEAKGPGKFHKLKVKVRAKGVDVSHRSGYFETMPFTQRTPLARRFEAAEVLVKGIGQGQPIPLRALAVPYRRSDTGIVVSAVIEADGRSLLPDPPPPALALEAYGYAVDEHGTLRDFVALASNLEMAKVGERLRETGVQWHATFVLPPGRNSLRFLVRDVATGRAGAQWLDLSIPPLVPGEVVLLPPFVMDDRHRWLVLEAASPAARVPESPFRVGAEPFTPRARPRLANGKTESICLLAFDGGRHYDPGASFEIKPQLLDASGQPVSAGRFAVAKAVAGEDGFRRFVLSYTPTGLPAGDYSLRVRLRDPGSGALSESYQAVRVE